MAVHFSLSQRREAQHTNANQQDKAGGRDRRYTKALETKKGQKAGGKTDNPHAEEKSLPQMARVRCSTKRG